MTKDTKQTDEAIIDHLKANDPDAEVRAEYWRGQYNELLEHTNHDRKERKHMDLISRLLCYTLYAVNIGWTVMCLCSYEGEDWDSTQRLLWCLVLMMNVGFAVFVLMSRLVVKQEKKWCDYHWKTTQEMLKMRAALDVAEHNLAVLEEENAKNAQKSEKTKKK